MSVFEALKTKINFNKTQGSVFWPQDADWINKGVWFSNQYCPSDITKQYLAYRSLLWIKWQYIL